MTMMDVRFDRVSKRYRLRRVDEPGRSRVARAPGAGTTEDFWALRDVSFEVPHGETLGIIGHNGAGKSTLLKLMSRITAPTAGEITLKGAPRSSRSAPASTRSSPAARTSSSAGPCSECDGGRSRKNSTALSPLPVWGDSSIPP